MIRALIWNEWQQQQRTVWFLLSGTVFVWAAGYLLLATRIAPETVTQILGGIMFGLPLLFLLSFSDATAGEFQHRTAGFLLGLPVSARTVYRVKYGVNLAVLLGLTAIDFLLLGSLTHFAGLMFMSTGPAGSFWWFAAAGLALLLLSHAGAFFGTMAGRNSSNSIAGLLLVGLLLVLGLPGIAPILVFPNRITGMALAIYLALAGFLFYPALLWFGGKLWQRISCGQPLTGWLIRGGLAAVIVPWLIWGITCGATWIELQMTIRSIRQDGMITDARQYPADPTVTDLFPALKEWMTDYQTWMDHARQEFFLLEELKYDFKIRSSDDLSRHEPPKSELPLRCRRFLASPRVQALYDRIAKLAAPERIGAYPDRSRNIPEFDSINGPVNAINMLEVGAWIDRRENRIPDMLNRFRTALKLATVWRHSNQNMEIYYQCYTRDVIRQAIFTAALTPEAAAFYRSLLPLCDQADVNTSNDVSYLIDRQRKHPAMTAEQRFLTWVEPSGHPGSRGIARLLLLAAYPGSLHQTAKTLRQQTRFYQFGLRVKTVPFFKDIRAEHDRFFADLRPAKDHHTWVVGHYQFRTRAAGHKLALALLLYRIAHGQFPEQLAALTPEILPRVPVSAFTGVPFAYRRDRDGFVLENDDGPNGSEPQNGFRLEFQPLPVNREVEK